MRPARVTSLLAPVLIGCAWCISAAAPARAAVEEKPPPWSVVGHGFTDEDARKDALEEARKVVVAYLEKQRLPVEWQPTLEFIAERLVQGSPKYEPSKDPWRNAGMEHQATLTVTVTHRDVQEIVKEDRKFKEQQREARVEQRNLEVGKALAVLVAVLAAVAGYFRLDEATKGYYTAWLRLAAVGLVGGIGAGLYWLL